MMELFTQSLLMDSVYDCKSPAGSELGQISHGHYLPWVHSADEVWVEDKVYSRLTKPRTKNENGSFMQLPGLWMDVAAVSGESITLRLTYSPVPSKKHFLDRPSLFITHSCERLSSRSFVTRTSRPTMLCSCPSLVLSTPAYSDLGGTFNPHRVPPAGLASWVCNSSFAQVPCSDRPST